MQHIWQNNKCERCKIGRESRTKRFWNHGFSNDYTIKHYMIYYVSGFIVDSKPNCYFPGQLKLDFDYA